MRIVLKFAGLKHGPSFESISVHAHCGFSFFFWFVGCICSVANKEEKI